ncbi:bifunctional diguanylate cyclase/phosphodiesterase [Neptuniibacter sp.]|uniref:putative bifunctional diguanylate cyclase/phosphodiesterase n=1 Tax=Neptuniibacter sp. TaxID=1962643 RepID=UPI002639481C|nr:bifunctional diguanylate cyclase/phosphodiesterase [Neptuniibacter sp.]MCP4595227.1 EAL domain-containing protein [Neptuniibacter sp.]
MAEKKASHKTTNTRWLTERIFPEDKAYLVDLNAPEYANIEPGQLKLVINLDQAFQPFFDRAVNVFVVGLIRNVLLAILLIALFYYTITKPLAVLANQFSKLHPERASDKRLSVSRRHEDTELGQLANAGNEFIEMVQLLLKDKKESHRALEQSEMRLNQLIDQVPQLIVALNEYGDILFCNQRFADFYERRPGDVAGMALRQVHLLHDQIDTLELAIHNVRVNGSQAEMREYIWSKPDGEAHYFSAQIAPFEHFNDPAILVVATDISEQKLVQDHISHMANHDTLTGLPNRALLNDRLEQSLATCKRTGEYNALLFIDLDHFKTINDSLGHGVGDLLLKKVSNILSSQVRGNDTVARLGGDEFVILMQSFDEDQGAVVNDVESICNKLLTSLSEPIAVKQHQLRIGASIGVVIFPMAEKSIDDLMRFADTAMYHAKENGRNGFAFYHQAMSLAVEKQRNMEIQLHHALQNEEFKVHYQPLVDLNGHICGFEALIRWQHPTKGTISPVEFIPSLEISGLIIPVSDWLIDHCCHQIVKWREDGFWQEGWYLSINISPQQFYQENMMLSLQRRVDKYGIALSDLCLEITETVAVENIEFAVNRLEKLRSLGATIALDDFGTGYSSLSYLKDLPIDIVKIDRAFVQELGTKSKAESIVEAVALIAKAYDLKIVAEGIETPEQMKYANEIGCHIFQGFYIERPVAENCLKANYSLGETEKSELSSL